MAQDLERRVQELEAQLAEALVALRELARGAERRRQTTQRAVDGLSHSIDVLFGNVKVPGVVHDYGRSYRIE